MKFARTVTLDVSAGSTNAYRSVLSATGSFEIAGASRWEDIEDHPCAYPRIRDARRGALVTISFLPPLTTTGPGPAAAPAAQTRVPGSEGVVPALAFSVRPRTLGAAAKAPTVAAPIAAPCKNFRRDILFFGSSTMQFPSGGRDGSTRSTRSVLRGAAPSAYFVMC